MDYDKDVFLHTGMVTMMWFEDAHDSIILTLLDGVGIPISLKTKSVEFVRGHVALGTRLTFEGKIVGVIDNKIHVIAERIFVR
jgi:hypothetical protein